MGLSVVQRNLTTSPSLTRIKRISAGTAPRSTLRSKVSSRTCAATMVAGTPAHSAAMGSVRVRRIGTATCHRSLPLGFRHGLNVREAVQHPARIEGGGDHGGVRDGEPHQAAKLIGKARD